MSNIQQQQKTQSQEKLDGSSDQISLPLCSNQCSTTQPSIGLDVEPQNQPLLVDYGTNQSLSNVDFKTRKKFIIKVYGILCIQLFFTFLLCFIANYSQGLRDLLINPINLYATPFYWVCFSICIVTEIAILCFKRIARRVPINYIALSIFTITFAFMITGACAASYDYYENGAVLVAIAAFMTLAITIALTMYAVKTKNDMTKFGGSLFIFSTALFFFMLFSIFYFSDILWILLSSLSAILYGFYLIHDTQLIIGGKSHQLSIDDYIIAAMLIYIDIIEVFIDLLDILATIFGKRK